MARKKQKKTKHKPIRLPWWKAIVELRARRDWSIRRLADEVGVWHPTIVRWENKQRRPRTYLRKVLTKLMDGVNITASWPA